MLGYPSPLGSIFTGKTQICWCLKSPHCFITQLISPYLGPTKQNTFSGRFKLPDFRCSSAPSRTLDAPRRGLVSDMLLMPGLRDDKGCESDHSTGGFCQSHLNSMKVLIIVPNMLKRQRICETFHHWLYIHHHFWLYVHHHWLYYETNQIISIGYISYPHDIPPRNPYDSSKNPPLFSA